jgi:hypothetical protein
MTLTHFFHTYFVHFSLCTFQKYDLFCSFEKKIYTVTILNNILSVEIKYLNLTNYFWLEVYLQGI